jgi:hypothetical protein
VVPKKKEETMPAPKRTYAPAVEDSLPSALAKLSESPADLLNFVRTYGLLGFTDEKNGKPLPGEPCDWIRAHARTVSAILELGELIREGDSYALQETLPGISGPFAKRSEIYHPGPIATVNWPGNPLAAARELVHKLINPNLAGIRRELRLRGDGTSRSVFAFDAMIDVVYWRLADSVAGDMIRRCEDCRRPFISRDKRNKYCPAAPGVRRSRCGIRKNVADFRERGKGGEQ